MPHRIIVSRVFPRQMEDPLGNPPLPSALGFQLLKALSWACLWACLVAAFIKLLPSLVFGRREDQLEGVAGEEGDAPLCETVRIPREPSLRLRPVFSSCDS